MSYTGPDNYYIPSFRGTSVYLSNTTNRLDGTLCYKDNNFTLDTLPVNISMPCRLNGQIIILYSEERQSVKYPDVDYKASPSCDILVNGNML